LVWQLDVALGAEFARFLVVERPVDLIPVQFAARLASWRVLECDAHWTLLDAFRFAFVSVEV